mgnify:FL=1
MVSVWSCPSISAVSFLRAADRTDEGSAPPWSLHAPYPTWFVPHPAGCLQCFPLRFLTLQCSWLVVFGMVFMVVSFCVWLVGDGVVLGVLVF